jgi:hypothetical protein
MKYTNLDGVSVETSEHTDDAIKFMNKCGYNLGHAVRGQLIGSELEVHTRNVGRTAIWAFLNAGGHYAYVLLDNGKFIDGCYHEYHDHTVCLS